jgi:NitT/TauT family transport system substrate-binding protein
MHDVRRRVAPLLVVGALASSACATSSDDPVVHLQVGDHGIVGEAPTYVALERGYFRDEGLDVELVSIRSGSDMIPLLAQGSIDAGAGSVSAGLFNATADDVGVRIVADSARVAAGERAHLALVVRSDLQGEITDVADLEGRTVAINAPGAGLEVQLAAALAQGSLGMDDVEIRHVGFAHMIPALASGQVDAAIVPEPFLTLGRERGVFTVLRSVGEILPDHQISVLLFSPRLAADDDVAIRYLRAYLRGVADYRAALVDRTTAPGPVIDAITAHVPIEDRTLFDRMAYHDLDPAGMVDVTSLTRDLDHHLEAGSVTEGPDLAEIIDLRLVTRARESLS